MNIILYANRNTGMLVLLYLLAKGHKVKVITEDDLIIEVSKMFGLEIVDFDTMGVYDKFICCHGRKIIDKKYLIDGKVINIHPCLFKYKGHDPIKRYVENKDTIGSVESHHMIEEVDAGKIINRQVFDTPVCMTRAEFYNIALPYYLRCLEGSL